MDEVIGFSLSQEELFVALFVADLPAPVGYDDLEDRVFGDLAENARAALLASAERSMLARGYLDLGVDKSVLDETVYATLAACTQPRRTWMVLHQPKDEPQRTSYFHQGERVLVAHMQVGAIHQFLQLGDTSDIRAVVLELVAPVTDANPASLAGSLAESTFAAIANAAGQGDTGGLRKQLQEAGWNTPTIEAFAATIDQLRSITAFARIGYAAESPLERAFSIVHGAGTHWIVRLSAPHTVELEQIGGPALVRGLSEFAQGAA